MKTPPDPIDLEAEIEKLCDRVCETPHQVEWLTEQLLALFTTYSKLSVIEGRRDEWAIITDYIQSSYGFDWYPADFKAFRNNRKLELKADEEQEI